MSKSKEKFGIVLPIILLSYFMILLDNSIIFTSTVKIAQELHLNSQTLAWVSSAYTLTFGGFQLFGGRIGDVFGRKRVFFIWFINGGAIDQRRHDYLNEGISRHWLSHFSTNYFGIAIG